MGLRYLRILFSITLLCILLASVINHGQAVEQTEYLLEIRIDVSCPIPFQSVNPVSVNVELTNIGNATFNGTLTINGKTEDGSYSPIEYPILNLTKNSTTSLSNAYRTDDAGTYWFTIEIEPNQSYSNIKLYQDSILQDEGYRVEMTKSVFLHSFTEFIAIIAIAVSAIVAIVVGVYTVKKRK
jgi:hypothetical protein